MKTSACSTIFITLAPPSPSPAPTAVLLGPFGSSRRSMAPHLSLYRTLGYNTVFTTAPLSVVFSLSQTKARPFLLSLLRVLASDVRLLTGGLVFAPVASGGGVVLPHLASLLAVPPARPSPTSVLDYPAHNPPPVMHDLLEDDVPVITAVRTALAALVCDSCPAYPHPDLSARTLVKGLQLASSPLVSAVVTFCLRVATRVHDALFGDVSARMWRTFRGVQLPCPELYVYTPDDDELDLPALQELVAYRKAIAGPCELRLVRVEEDDEALVRKTEVEAEDYRHEMEEVNYWVNMWRRRAGIAEWVVPRKGEGKWVE